MSGVVGRVWVMGSSGGAFRRFRTLNGGFGSIGVAMMCYLPIGQSSSFLGLPYRILNMNPQKELLWGLWL